MDIAAYISSGIIENYVLGLTSPEESGELERMAAIYPEIQELVEAYRKTMDAYDDLHAVEPPAGLKGRVMAAIHNEHATSSVVASNTKAAAKENIAIFKIRKWKRVAAAAILLLIGSLVLNGVYIGKYRKSRDRYTALVQSHQSMATENKVMETRLEKVEKNMQVLMNPAMKPIVMEGVNKHRGMVATVYWDAQSRHIYLGTTNLPDPPSGMAYQLWAIVNGKPVGMGMYNPASQKGLIAMKDVAHGEVQAFAITLEKQEGSITPTMDQMYVIGKMSVN